jgi:hypothetical protein
MCDVKLTNEELAFEESYKNFSVKAYWGDEPDARIEIFEDGRPYATYAYPAYRIFNIAAHFSDMVEGTLAQRTADKLADYERLSGHRHDEDAEDLRPPLSQE